MLKPRRSAADGDNVTSHPDIPPSGDGRVALAKARRAVSSSRERRVLPSAVRPDAVACVASVVSAFLLGAEVLLGHGLRTGLLPVAYLLPVWLGIVRFYRGLTLLLALSFLAIASGFILGWMNDGERAIANNNLIAALVLVASGLLGVPVLLWAARIIGVEYTAAVFGFGMLVNQFATGIVADPWKFNFARPVAIIVVALLSRRSRPARSVAALLVLGIVSVVFDYRSFLGFCVFAAILIVWQVVIGSKRSRVRATAPLLMLAALGLALYYLGTALLVDGLLGTQVQQRSIVQIQTSGSLLLGGRPEWAATIELMRQTPTGFGFGAVPTLRDISAGDTGLMKINVDAAGNGLQNYMFGDQFRLHSIVADLWANAGIVGLLVGVWSLVLIARALARSLSARTASPLLLLVVAIALWDLAFSPIFTGLVDLTLALFVCLATRRSDEPVGPTNAGG